MYSLLFSGVLVGAFMQLTAVKGQELAEMPPNVFNVQNAKAAALCNPDNLQWCIVSGLGMPQLFLDVVPLQRLAWSQGSDDKIWFNHVLEEDCFKVWEEMITTHYDSADAEPLVSEAPTCGDMSQAHDDGLCCGAAATDDLSAEAWGSICNAANTPFWRDVEYLDKISIAEGDYVKRLDSCYPMAMPGKLGQYPDESGMLKSPVYPARFTAWHGVLPTTTGFRSIIQDAVGDAEYFSLKIQMMSSGTQAGTNSLTHNSFVILGSDLNADDTTQRRTITQLNDLRQPERLDTQGLEKLVAENPGVAPEDLMHTYYSEVCTSVNVAKHIWLTFRRDGGYARLTFDYLDPDNAYVYTRSPFDGAMSCATPIRETQEFRISSDILEAIDATDNADYYPPAPVQLELRFKRNVVIEDPGDPDNGVSAKDREVVLVEAWMQGTKLSARYRRGYGSGRNAGACMTVETTKEYSFVPDITDDVCYCEKKRCPDGATRTFRKLGDAEAQEHPLKDRPGEYWPDEDGSFSLDAVVVSSDFLPRALSFFGYPVSAGNSGAPAGQWKYGSIEVSPLDPADFSITNPNLRKRVKTASSGDSP